MATDLLANWMYILGMSRKTLECKNVFLKRTALAWTLHTSLRLQWTCVKKWSRNPLKNLQDTHWTMCSRSQDNYCRGRALIDILWVMTRDNMACEMQHDSPERRIQGVGERGNTQVFVHWLLHSNCQENDKISSCNFSSLRRVIEDTTSDINSY